MYVFVYSFVGSIEKYAERSSGGEIIYIFFPNRDIRKVSKSWGCRFYP